MRLLLIRHAQTAGNLAHRYIGATDEPLCPLGEQTARDAAPVRPPDTVYVTTMRRTQQTAKILFPTARQIIVPGLREMDFGAFEGKNYEEMAHDAAYRAWVDGGCLGTCPGGESRAAFCARVCEAFTALRREWLAAGTESAVLVVHGGTIMALLSSLARPEIDYYAAGVGNCRGVSCTLLADADGKPALLDVRKLDALSQWEEKA